MSNFSKIPFIHTMGVLAVTVAVAFPLQAQHEHGVQGAQGDHQHMMQHHQMMSGHGAMTPTSSSAPTLVGQDAFAAVQEIVRLLEADPATDWSQVNIDALRAHLIDMNLVTLNARVTSEPVDGGAEYRVTGEGDTLAAIQRMVPAHAAQMNLDADWITETALLADGVLLTVKATDAAGEQKVRALGFMGFMVQGDHHQPHHLMMAGGSGVAHEGGGPDDAQAHQH